MAKSIVCRCEDVSAADIAHAVAKGYCDLEEVKRFTGFGTGPCQGKECHAVVARELVKLTGQTPASVEPFTSRSPLVPTQLRALSNLCALEAPYQPPGTPQPPLSSRSPVPASPLAAASPPHSDAALPERTDTLIIGAGVIGLAIAYYLTQAGLDDVTIVDRGYLAGGASGRNGGGVRQQWSTEVNVRLMQESVQLCREFATEIGVNNWFRQGGYLFLARSDKELRKLQGNVDLHGRLGVGTRLISAQQAGSLVPELNLDGIAAAAYNPSDGIVFPWPFLWGYAQRAKDKGAGLFTHTNVKAIERDGAGFLVRTARGTIAAKRVINAAGAWSSQVAAMLGVKLPTWPVRHEICSSEPLKPFLRPMVSDLSCGLYCSQSMRGELVGGCSVPDEGTDLDMSSTSRFLGTYATRLVTLMPSLGRVKMLRQWAGPYEYSPDGNPLLGTPTGVDNFYLAAGFVGHGFMMAPVVGKLYAAWLLGGAAAKHDIFSLYAAQRFDRGVAAPREDFNIG